MELMIILSSTQIPLTTSRKFFSFKEIIENCCLLTAPRFDPVCAEFISACSPPTSQKQADWWIEESKTAVTRVQV